MGPTDDNVNCDPRGEYNYRVCINDKNICFFKHYRINGLAECLQAAAKAVESREIALVDSYEQTLK